MGEVVIMNIAFLPCVCNIFGITVQHLPRNHVAEIILKKQQHTNKQINKLLPGANKRAQFLHLFLLYSYFPHDPFLTLFFLFFICFRCLYFCMFCSTGLTEMKLTPISYLVVNGVYNELTCMKQLTEAKL